MLRPLTMDFGRAFGRAYCVPMFLEEMRTIPEQVPGIQETEFYVSGFNWFIDWVVSSLVMAGRSPLPLEPEGFLPPALLL